MALPKDQAWFPQRRYGYGWGLPTRWQGWVVLLVYFSIVLFAGPRFARPHPLYFDASVVVVASGLLIAICAWKGERPRWRWGRSADDDKKR